MAMMMPAAPKTVSGTIEAVNPKGMKVNGEWFNWSRWAEDPTPPERGQQVTLTLDKAGFVRSVEADGPAPAGRNSFGTVSGQKDRIISRLAVLKAAAEFAASRPEAKSSDVLKIADLWYAWATQEDAE